jgi:ParB-like chromosome segregation protein Spo0J
MTNGRVMAARKLGMDEVPTIELAGLSDTQKRAYILTLESTGEVFPNGN